MINPNNPNAYYEEKDQKKGLIVALCLHLLLAASIAIGLFLEPDAASGPLQLELWAEGTEQVVKPPAESRTPDPADENTVNPDDDRSKIEPTPAPPTPKVAPKPVVTEPPKPQVDPDIAIAKKQEEQKKAEAQKKAEEQKKLEAQKKAEEQKKLAEQKKAEEEKKLAEQKKAEEEKRQQEADAKKKAAVKAAADARVAKETRAKANQAGADLRAAMRGDINSTAGIPGGINDRNQRGGGGGNNDLIRAIQSCVQPKLIFNGGQRLQAYYAVEVGPDLKAVPDKTRITRRSGNVVFDKAVVNALNLCARYPAPLRGKPFKGTYTYTPGQR